MRLLIFVAVMATAIVMFSCEWFSKKHSSAIELQGKWKLDSISKPKDTSGIGAAMALIIAEALQQHSDTAVWECEFIKDSVITQFAKHDADTSWYQFNPATSMLHIQQNKDIDTIAVKALGDSIISFTSKDSMVMFLRKQ